MVRQRVDVTGVDLQGCVEIGKRLIEIALVPIGLSPAAQGNRIVGFRGEHLVVVGNSAVVSALAAENASVVDQRVDVLRGKRKAASRSASALSRSPLFQ